MTAIVATPAEPTGRVLVEARDATGQLREVTVSRWSTDILGCEVWSVLRTVDLGEGRATAHRGWHTTPSAACQAAVRCFQPAGYGAPPFAPSMLIRGPIAPTGWILADRVRAA